MKIKVRGIEIDLEQEPSELIFLDAEEKEKFTKKLEGDKLTIPSEFTTTHQDILDMDFYPEKVTPDTEVLNPDFKDKYIRCLSDFENFKKRTQREKDNMMNIVMTEALEIVFEIENDISMAISRSSQKEGLQIIRDKIVSNLSKMGIEEIPTTNYNPDFHHPIAYSQTQGEGDIASVVSTGWMRNKKPIVFSKVILNGTSNE